MSMMLAARDQENVAHAQRQATINKQQNLHKTPARFPKTPMRVPLNDENRTQGITGKILQQSHSKIGSENTIPLGGKTASKSQWQTPAALRTMRAPLGNKTTNAKARPNQQLGVKDIVQQYEATHTKPTNIRRPKPAPVKLDSSKLAVHNDNASRVEDEEEEELDFEYCPPPVPAIPYESEIFPRDCIDLSVLKPENRLKGYYEYYINDRDDSGLTRLEREMERKQEERLRKLDEQIKKDIAEWDWSVKDDSPRKKSVPAQPVVSRTTAQGRIKGTSGLERPSSSLSPRSAATALGLKPDTRPAPVISVVRREDPVKKTMGSLIAGRGPIKAKLPVSRTTPPVKSMPAASRATVGYSHGRAVSNAAHGSGATGPSKANQLTVPTQRRRKTPDTSAETEEAADEDEFELKRRFPFLAIFDEEDAKDGGQVGLPFDDTASDSDDDFQLNLGL